MAQVYDSLMSRRLARAGYVVVALVVAPIVAYNIAVASTGLGFGWTGFFAVLFGLPAAVALVAALALRRSRGATAAGTTGAVVAALVLFVVVVFVTLSRS